MLTSRLNEPFSAVSWHDPALAEIDDEVLRNYLLTRDFSKLPLEGLSTQPTIFECLPLQQEWEHLPERALTAGAEAMWRVFATHVQSASAFDHSNGKPILKFKSGPDGVRVVDDKCRKDIPMQIVQEISGVIVERAMRGPYSPFTVPDTFSRERTRLKLHRALFAKTEDVK